LDVPHRDNIYTANWIMEKLIYIEIAGIIADYNILIIQTNLKEHENKKKIN
jgi:hypothetical protein